MKAFSWDAARKFCRRQFGGAGDLAGVHSSADNRKLQLAVRRAGAKRSVWINLNDKQVEKRHVAGAKCPQVYRK